MKNFVLKLTGLGLVMLGLFFSSCEDDTIITPLGPDIFLENEVGFLSSDSDLIIGETFSVRVTTSPGDAQLQSFEISEGSSKLPATQFTVNNGSITSNNPFLITGVDKDGATYTIDIVPSATILIGDATTYTFTVTDESGETASTDLIVTTIEEPGTDIDVSLDGVLLNQAGPAGTGGSDLDTGDGTGSGNAAAEIRDMGIDCNLPTTSNWRKRIGTVNGADMRAVDLSQLENFTFDNVTKKESIIEAYDTGISLSEASFDTNCDGVSSTVQDVSDEVSEGDMFVVFANSTYYLVRIDEINETTNNNNDNYELSIKY